MKKGFVTNSGSEYILDTDKKEITGGKFSEPVQYVGTPIIMIGGPAEIILTDGRVLRTSTVKSYF